MSALRLSGATAPRDHDGNGGLHYVNRMGRNNLTLMKVARDQKDISFYVHTRDPIAPAPAAGLCLLLDTGQNAQTGWQGYDFIVRTTSDGAAWLEKNSGGWQWARVARVASRMSGQELHLKIPRAALGLPAGGGVSLDFKWVDNLQKSGDIMDFYLSGDVAPGAASTIVIMPGKPKWKLMGIPRRQLRP